MNTRFGKKSVVVTARVNQVMTVHHQMTIVLAIAVVAIAVVVIAVVAILVKKFATQIDIDQQL